MGININPLKGFSDYYPEKYLEKEYITNILNNVSKSFGYIYYEGPSLEDTSLYEIKSGQSIVDEAYSFVDRGDRKVTMRPEMTPTLARMLALRSVNYKKPMRWYSIPLIFRNDNPQKAREREFSQYNADIIGSSSIKSDVEILDLSMNILRKLGFKNEDFNILINNRLVAYEILSKYTDNIDLLIKIIDKKNKLPEKDFNNLILNNIKSPKLIDNLLKYLNNQDKDTPAEISKFIDEGLTFGLNFEYDPTIVRGLDYYTGNIFEIWDKKRLIKRSIFGGGRYSNLVATLGGENLDSVGIATGIEVLIPLINEYNKMPNNNISYDYFVSTFENIDNKIYYRILSNLRNKGYSVIFNVNNEWNLKKQLEYALDINVKNFIILGEKELKEEIVLVKDLGRKTEKKILIDDL